MRAILTAISLMMMLTTQVGAEEIKMSCAGDLYKYQAPLLGKTKILLRKAASWVPWCNRASLNTAENCHLETSERGGHLQAFKRFIYGQSKEYQNSNLKLGFRYKVLQSEIIDFETQKLTSQIHFHSDTHSFSEPKYIKNCFLN